MKTTTLGLSILSTLGACNAKGNKPAKRAAQTTTPAAKVPGADALAITQVVAEALNIPAQPPLPAIEATPAAEETVGNPPASTRKERRSGTARVRKSPVAKMQTNVARAVKRAGVLATRSAAWGNDPGAIALARKLSDAQARFMDALGLFFAGQDDDGNPVKPVIDPAFVPPVSAGRATRGAGRAERAAVLKVGEQVEIRTAKRELYADGCDAEKPLTVYKAPREGGKSVMLTDADGIRVSVAIDHVLLVGVEAARKAAREARVAKRNAAK